VEHVLAAIAAMGIDDITIEMDGPEPPILDGSAAPFYNALSTAGLASIDGQPEILTLSEPVRIIDGESVYEAFPAPNLELDVTIDRAAVDTNLRQSRVVRVRAVWRAHIRLRS
jgi:UDP-3-O-acyl-N-acetylglucosamine deacetylase